MAWEFIARISIVFILTAGGVILLQPVMTRLGALLDALALQKTRAPDEENHRLRNTVETLNERLTLMEERLDFTERLIGRGGSPPPHAARTSPATPRPPKSGTR